MTTMIETWHMRSMGKSETYLEPNDTTLKFGVKFHSNVATNLSIQIRKKTKIHTLRKIKFNFDGWFV